MYLELHKRGIRDVLDMNWILREHFDFLVSENDEELGIEETTCMEMISKLEKPYFEYFLSVFGEEMSRVEREKEIRSRRSFRLKRLILKWIRCKGVEIKDVGLGDVEKRFEELWAFTKL